jgi:hypothetical protein
MICSRFRKWTTHDSKTEAFRLFPELESVSVLSYLIPLGMSNVRKSVFNDFQYPTLWGNRPTISMSFDFVIRPVGPLEPLRRITFNRYQGTTISKSEKSPKLSQKVKDVTTVWKSERCHNYFEK